MQRKHISLSAFLKLAAVVALTASVVVAAGTTVAWSWLPPASVAGVFDERAAQGGRRERVESELVTIRPWGFEPAELKRPAGPFFLAVVNRSGFLDADVRLTRVVGQGRQLVPLPKGKKGWRQEVALPPGEYVLTEVNHGGGSCKIIITPR